MHHPRYFAGVDMLDTIRRHIFLHQLEAANKELDQFVPSNPEEVSALQELRNYFQQEQYLQDLSNNKKGPPAQSFLPSRPEHYILEGFKALFNYHYGFGAQEFFFQAYESNPEIFFELMWVIDQRDYDYSSFTTIFSALAKPGAAIHKKSAFGIFNELIENWTAHHYENIHHGNIAILFHEHFYNNLTAEEINYFLKNYMAFSYPNILPEQFLKYKIDNNPFSKGIYLGIGGYAAVHKAVHTNGNKKAVKYYTDEHGQGAVSFFKEVMALSVLNAQPVTHPHIVKLEGFYSKPFLLVMPFEENTCSLDKYIDNHPSLDIRQKSTITRQLASGLAFLHSILLIHSDLSLQNILISIDIYKQILVKWIDFGAAQLNGVTYLPRTCRTYISFAAYELLFENDEKSKEDFLVFNEKKLNNEYHLNSLNTGLHHGPMSDVCSFAFVIKYLFKWRFPERFTLNDTRKQYVYEGKDPTVDIPQEMPLHFKNALLTAFAWDPKKRCSAQTLVSQLDLRP